MKRTFFNFFLFSLYSIFTFSFTLPLHAKQLDKVALVVNDTSFTLSQIKRIQETIAVRKNVSPLVYDKTQFELIEIADKLINRQVIRGKLSEVGYSIGDDYVEEQIKGNEKKLGVNRPALMQFLTQQGFTFDEYFETIREAIEYSIFIQRVVSPIIAITDQEVKNTYFKKYSGSARMNFKYSLTDYSIEKELSHANKFASAISEFKKTNIISEDSSAFSSNNLDEITEEDISSELNLALKNVGEGEFTKPFMLNGKLHVFYVQKKDLVESAQYLKEKEKIRNELFEKAVVVEAKSWLLRERTKHFIKNNL